VTREITLYTRADCSLCDDTAAELRRLSGALNFSIVERDVDADPDLLARFNDVVPVVAAGERLIAQAPVDFTALRASLLDALD
jgi:thioredoxin reductase (NADPH)